MQVLDILQRLTTPKADKELDVVMLHVDSYYNLTYSQPNLGVLYIATLLQDHGFRVKVLSPKDLFEMTKEDLEKLFTQARPKLVGFYTMSDTIFQVATHAERIAKWVPGVKFIAGGPLASALGPALNRYFKFDYIVKGEGEFSMLAVANMLCRGERTDLSTIPGLFYRTNGSVSSGAPTQFIKDLDALPNPNRSLVNNPLRFHVSTGRGCPYACTFCFQAVHGRGYRYRSAQHVVDEIIHNIEEHGHRAFDIIDDTFVANPKRVLEFCELLRDYRSRSNRDFVWYCEARVDILNLRPDLLQAMKEVGLIRLQIGIESGDPETLKHYEKRLKLGQLEELCRRISDVGGISMYGNFIMGGPFENRTTWSNSLKVAKKMLKMAPGLFETTASYLTPFPETPIYGHPERFGVRIKDDDYLTSLTLEECYCETEHLSRVDIRRMRHEFMGELGKTMRALVPKIPREQLLDWTPLRTIGPLQYDTRNWEDFLLRASYRPLRLTDPVEKEVYALSVGKLPLGRMVPVLMERLGLDGDPAEVLEHRVLPTLRKLEEHYQVIFHS